MVTVTYAGRRRRRRLVTHTQFERRGRVRRFTCQEASRTIFVIVATRTSNEPIRVCLFVVVLVCLFAV